MRILLYSARTGAIFLVNTISCCHSFYTFLVSYLGSVTLALKNKGNIIMDFLLCSIDFAPFPLRFFLY